MKILIDGTKNFYKACLHTHTTLSDGSMSPEKVKEEYLKRGYSAVAFTDHEILYDQSALTDENFVAINGYEFATNNDRTDEPILHDQSIHLNLLAKDPKNRTLVAYNRDYDWCHDDKQKDEAEKRAVHLNYERLHNLGDFNKTIAWANENGFLVVYNHPVWSLHTALDWSGIRGLFAVETYNAGSNYSGYTETRAPYDDLLGELYREAKRKGTSIAPLRTVFADDMHNFIFDEPGCVVIQADRLDYNSLVSALENGEFYSSTRPEFYDLRVDGGVLYGKTSPVRKVSVVGAGRNKVAVAGVAEEFAIPLPRGFNDYFRVEIEDENGFIATTNAFYGALDE